MLMLSLIRRNYSHVTYKLLYMYRALEIRNFLSLYYFFIPILFSSEDEVSKGLQGATAVAESASPSQHKPYEVD